jgi:signal transduction histidine kinase
VTNVGNDRTQLSKMAEQAKTAMGADTLDVLADRGYFKGEEILACEAIGVTPFVSKSLTSGAKAEGRFGKQDFLYIPEDDNLAHLAAIDGAVAQADDLLATFAALLRIAQIESRAARFTFTTVDLSAIADAVLEVYRPAAQEKRQELEGHIAASVYFAGDRLLLTQMVANIAENAIRHAPEGASIEIALQPEPKCGPLLTISDNGPGIPQSEREKVFRRFYRLDSSRGSPGNGLGLSLVAAIAELHGVSVRLAANNPGGLKVTLAFPPMNTECASSYAALPSTQAGGNAGREL